MSEGQDVLDMEDTQRLLNTTTRDTDRNARLRNLLRKYDVIPVKNNLDDFEEKYSEVRNFNHISVQCLCFNRLRLKIKLPLPIF